MASAGRPPTSPPVLERERERILWGGIDIKMHKSGANAYKFPPFLVVPSFCVVAAAAGEINWVLSCSLWPRPVLCWGLGFHCCVPTEWSHKKIDKGAVVLLLAVLRIVVRSKRSFWPSPDNNGAIVRALSSSSRLWNLRGQPERAPRRERVEGFKGIPPPTASSTSFPFSLSFFVLDPSSSDDYIMRLSTFFFFFPLSALSLSAGREVSKWLAKGPLKATGENLCLARRQGTHTEQHRGGLRLLHFATPPRKRRCACVSSCFYLMVPPPPPHTLFLARAYILSYKECARPCFSAGISPYVNYSCLSFWPPPAHAHQEEIPSYSWSVVSFRQSHSLSRGAF